MAGHSEYILEFARAAQTDDPYAFGFLPQTYLLRTGGGGFQSAEFGWSQELLSDLAALRKPGCDPAAVQRIGEALRRFLLPLGFAEQEARLLADSRAGREVVLTVRSAAAELYALPWELLTEKSTGQHLGALPNVLLRYEWPETRTTLESPLPRGEGGRVLFAWSAAAGSVPASEHGQALQAACRAGAVPFDVDADVLAHVSPRRLVAALSAAREQGRPIAVLHLLCHGGAAGSTFGLWLDGEQAGEPVLVDAGRLRQLLGPFADMVRLVVLAACDSGNSGALGNHLGSVAQALHRAGFAQVIASRYPLAVAAANQLTRVLYQELLGATRSLEQALRAAGQELARDASHLDWASLQLYARSADGVDSRPVVFRPFRGLLSFQPQHGRFFFGRDREIEEVLAALSALGRAERPRLLVVAGASGSGKSSLVLAGAAPRIVQAAGPRLRLAVMQPGSQPQAALDAALRAAGGADTAQDVLLIVDQFEEIFTHVSDPAVRDDFARRLWRLAAEPAARTQIIVTLRVDFLGECGGVTIDPAGGRLDRIAYDQAHRVFVAQLGPAELRAAIEGPARRVGLELEPGLQSRMLEAVGSEPGALPLLEYTLDLLWLRREGRLLTQAGYDAVGQVAGALSQHADSLLSAMSEAEQREARRLLVRLVHTGDGVRHGTRQRAAVARLRPKSAAAAAHFDRVLAQLVDARLLFRSEQEHDPTIEVAHEALIRRWQRLTEWLQQDRELLGQLEKLEALLHQWRLHKVLLRGEQLRFAESVAGLYPDDFPEEARTLLRASQRQERQTLWLKRLSTMLVMSAMITFGILFFLARRSNLQAQFARNQLIALLAQTSRNPSPAEMAQALARLRLELELRPDLALAALAQVPTPYGAGLLSDQAEYLVAAGRFGEVEPLAQAAFRAESRPAERLHSAVTGWSAARFLGDREGQERWAARVTEEYTRLPDGFPARGFRGTAQLLLRDQAAPRTARALSDVLAVYTFLQAGKSDRRIAELGRLLHRGL